MNFIITFSNFEIYKYKKEREREKIIQNRSLFVCVYMYV